jgi:predicted Zn-dependent protease
MSNFVLLKNKTMKHVFFLLGAILLLNACSRNPVTGKKELILMSEGQERAMGAEADPSIVSEYGLYQDDKMQAFINEKGKQMAAISHRPDLPFEFKILDSPVVNAFAVPGGYVYFTRGIMAHFNNEAEFAGVLGHEIGHVTARHTAQQQSKQMLGQLGMFVGLVVSDVFRQFADLAGNGLGLLFLKFSRGHESESDKLGVYYSTEIGYEAHEMAGFFKTLEGMSDGGRIPTFMSTHPDPGDRFTKVNQHADDVQMAKNLNKSNLKVNRESYLRMIDGLIYGEDPKQGYTEGNTFYHPELLFQFNKPADWQLVNSPSQVQMAPKDGKAIMFFELEQASNLDQAASGVIERNKIVVEDRANLNVNGMPAVALYGTQTSAAQNGQPAQVLKLMVYLIQYNNMIYKFVGLSTNQDFNTYFSNFQSTMKSFSKLTDPSKINKLPQRIKIVTANRTASLSDIMYDFGQASDNMSKLALLNGMELTETVNSGSMIKILESRK